MYFQDGALSSRYYMDIALGAIERGQERDLLVTLVPTATPAHALTGQPFDGFLVVDLAHRDPVVTSLLRGDRPVVTSAHVANHRGGMRMLLDHIWAQGGRDPLLVLPEEQLPWSLDITSAYSDWCAEKNLESRPVLRTSGEEVEAALSASPTVDSVIATGRQTVIAVVEAMRARSILLASYADEQAYATLTPPVTALDTHPRALGARLVDRLLEALHPARPGSPSSSALPLTLRVRASTGRA